MDIEQMDGNEGIWKDQDQEGYGEAMNDIVWHERS